MAYNGTNGDNLFQIDVGDLYWQRINGRWGYDTIELSSLGDYTFDRYSYWRMRHIEEIDFTNINGNLSVQVKGSMLRQADNDKLTITFGDTGSIDLEAKNYSGGTLYLDGAGTIDLSDTVNNYVHITDGSTLSVHGGVKSDTIFAGNGGMLLDGGTGNDYLYAGDAAGSDTIRFGVDYDADTVTQFDVSEDVVALEGFTISSLDALLALATEANGNTTFDFGNGDLLTLNGVALGELGGDNFTIDGEALYDGPPVVSLSLGTTAAQLNALIAGAEEGTTFVLADGNHIFDASIIIGRDNISLEGSASDAVTITFDFPVGTGGNGIVVQGTGDSYISTLPTDAIAGSSSLTLRDDHGFQAGDAIYVQQPNTQEYLDENGWTNVSMAEAEFRPFRESIHIIENVNGNSITLSTPLSFNLEASAGRFYSMDLTSDVTLSGFTITNNLGTTDAYDFTNTHAEFEGTSALLLENTVGINVTDINFIDVASTAINLSSTINALVDDIAISGAHNKGGGGNGYGVELHEAFNNTLTNLEIYDVRHSIVLSAWHAEVGNNIHISNTNRDINLHGSDDFDNTIMVEYSVLDYDIANGGSAWSIVSSGGTNHALTDFSSNDVTFSNAIGSNRNDTINGDESGSLLVGGYGYDTLTGGSSDDVLIGGTRRDTMTGGDGSDTFLLVMGDDLDRITDFEFGVGGDTLIFSNNSSVVDASGLTFTVSGDDVKVRYGSNSTVILENTALTDIDEDNFQFDPNGDISTNDFIIG
ncbi:MAG: hypothetical protein V3V02_06780 [Rhizobiaceae bacterium]